MTFEEVYKRDVSKWIEKKGNLSYLSWANAWAEFKKIYPDATYEVKKFDGVPYVHDSDTGYMVYTSVTADGLTYEMWLPVMDARNKTLMNATMFDINKTIMRCLAKNLAMFGLGLYIYAGEDLPEDEQQTSKSSNTAPKAPPTSKQPSEGRKPAQSDADKLKAAMERKIVFKGMERKLGELSAEILQSLAKMAKDMSLRDDMLRVMQYKFQEEQNAAEDEDLPF